MLDRLPLEKRLLLFHIPGIREAELFLPHPQNIYAHALPSAPKEAAAKMASLLR